LLVSGAHEVPGRSLFTRPLEHRVAAPEIGIPTPKRFHVHWTKFPLPQRVIDAGVEPPFLFFLADLEPYFYQRDPSVDDVALSHGANLQKMTMLLFVYKAHHVFDARAVVPTSIEHDDLARRRQ